MRGTARRCCYTCRLSCANHLVHDMKRLTPSHLLRLPLQTAEISATLESCGQHVGIRIVQIAGIARAHQAPVATRNTRDFEHGCTVMDPWHDPSP